MRTRQAEAAQRATREEATKLLKHNPFLSKNSLEISIKNRLGTVSSGTVSRIYNKHRRQL